MTTRLLKSSENINGLPIGFQEVEYLQSSGTQYIDTGVTINTATDEVELYYELLSGTQYKWIFGEHDTNARFGLGSGDGTNRRNIAYGSSTTQKADTYFLNSQHYYKANTEGVYIDGAKMVNYSSFSSTSTIYLFNLNLNNINYCTSSRIWGYKHSRDGVLIRDFIPALNPAGRPCMYDLVGKKAYYNLGTDEFTYGRKIIPVEYLESTGTQYIDTNYAFLDDFSWEITFADMALGTTVFGGRTSTNRTAILYRTTQSVSGDITVPIGSYNGTTTPFQLTGIQTGKHTVKMTVASSKGSVWVDGSQRYNDTSIDGTYISGVSQAIFADKFDDNDFREQTSAKVYALKMWQGTTLVRNYLPAIDENNTPYMFDKVTHACYINAGTGTFNYGKKLYSSKVRLYKDSEANKLPIGFKRVEYLENTGVLSARNWISTGIVPDTTTKWEVRLSFNNTTTGKLMGSGYLTGNRFNLGIESNKFRFAFNGWFDANSNITTPDTNPHTWVMDATTKTFNIDEYSTTTSQSFGTSTLPIALFGRCNNADGTTETSNAVVGKIYYSKIWQNGVLVSNMIPALDTTNTPCMYDTVTQTAFYNKGTGQFTYGAVIPNKVRLPQSTEIRFPAGYTEVEYLEGTGTQFIDTEYILNNNSEIEIICNSGDIHGTNLFGYRDASASSRNISITTSTNVAYTSDFNNSDYTTYRASLDGSGDKVVKIVLSKKERGFYNIDGSLINASTTVCPDVFTCGSSSYLMNVAGNPYFIECFKGKVYKCVIKESGVSIRYFIPALDPNGKPCMWDAVTKQPFYNQGTGEFTYGRSIQQVTYLEATGTQYINTNFKPTTLTDFEIEFSSTKTGVNNWIMGCATWVGVHYKQLNDNKAGVTNNSTAQAQQYVSYTPNNSKMTLKLAGNTVYTNGVSSGTITRYAGSQNLTLFGYQTNATTTQLQFTGSIYKVKIWDNNVPIYDFKPAIDSNNVGFMFDRVTHTIFDNKGTGSFSYGNAVPNKLRD